MNITKLFLIFALSTIIGAAALFLFPFYVSLLMAILISVVSALILYIFFQSSEIEALDFDELENQIDDEIQSSDEEVLVSENKAIKFLSSFKISLYSLLLSLFLQAILIFLLFSLNIPVNELGEMETTNLIKFVVFTLSWSATVFFILSPLFFVLALILKLFKRDIEITRGWIILFSILLGFLGFIFYNPNLAMQISFWTGGVLVALGVWLGPQSDNRYSSGYKNNESGGIVMITLLPGLVFLALGGLIYWLTQ